MSARPNKRARSSSSSSLSAKTLVRAKGTTGVGRIWKKKSNYTPMYFDPFPYKMHAVLRYSEVVSINPSTGIPGHYLFRANGIFDPNYTGTGHQPYGHDQYAAIYNHYQVLESTITMSPAQGNLDGIYGITLLADTTPEADYDTIREMKSTRMSITKDSNGSAPQTVTNYFNSKTFFNKSEQSALFGASPADSFYFDCWNEGRTNGVAGQNIPFLITITYKVMMFEPKKLGQS